MINFDLIIALILVVLVIILFVASRIDLLPKKTLPFIIGAAVGVLGATIFREQQRKALEKKFNEREQKIKEKEQHLKELKEKYQVSEQQLRSAQIKLDNQRAAYEKMLLQLKAENKIEKERIDNLSGEDLHGEFRSVFGTN